MAHPATHFVDESHLFQHGHETIRPHPPGGPAQQCFHAPQAQVLQVHARLIDQLQLLLLHRSAQAQFQRHAPTDTTTQAVMIETYASTELLGMVHGHVGVFEQALHVVTVLRITGHPQAQAQVKLVPAGEKRRIEQTL